MVSLWRASNRRFVYSSLGSKWTPASSSRCRHRSNPELWRRVEQVIQGSDSGLEWLTQTSASLRQVSGLESGRMEWLTQALGSDSNSGSDSRCTEWSTQVSVLGSNLLVSESVYCKTASLTVSESDWDSGLASVLVSALDYHIPD